MSNQAVIAIGKNNVSKYFNSCFCGIKSTLCIEISKNHVTCRFILFLLGLILSRIFLSIGDFSPAQYMALEMGSSKKPLSPKSPSIVGSNPVPSIPTLRIEILDILILYKANLCDIITYKR